MNSLQIVPDVFTSAIMVSEYCKERIDDRAVDFQGKENIGLQLNVVTHNCLIDECGSLGDIERTKKVLRLMGETEITKKKFIFTLLLKGYRRQYELEEAEQMEKQEVVVLNECSCGC